jgi:sarcosine oxidase subunit beta
VQHTLALGYASVEEVKRYTGLGTGPCGGKECMVHCARLCAAAGADERAVAPFTARPPIGPTPFAVLARAGEDE